MRIAPVALVALAIAFALPFADAFPGQNAQASAGTYMVGFTPGSLPLVAAHVQATGGFLSKASDTAGIAIAGKVVPSFVPILASLPFVQFVETNDPVYATSAEWNGVEWNSVEWNGVEWNGAEWNGAEWNSESTTADPGTGFQWGLEDIRASSAWSLTTGARKGTLCVVDSGIDATHKDLSPNLWKSASGGIGWNAINGGKNVSDDAGHGTHLSSVAAGAIGNSYGIAGVGNVRIMTVKALNKDGTGLEGDVAMGISWCADKDADVILLAITASPSETMDRAIASANSRDTLVVASAGNTGPCPACTPYPASNPLVLSVTATTNVGLPADFAREGPEVDLAAPGVDIAGAFPGGRFAYGSGTSQAAAFVAGVAALARDADPGMSVGDTKQILISTAMDYGVPGRDDLYGHGLVDAGATVAAVLD